MDTCPDKEAMGWQGFKGKRHRGMGVQEETRDVLSKLLYSLKLLKLCYVQ